MRNIDDEVYVDFVGCNEDENEEGDDDGDDDGDDNGFNVDDINAEESDEDEDECNGNVVVGCVIEGDACDEACEDIGNVECDGEDNALDGGIAKDEDGRDRFFLIVAVDLMAGVFNGLELECFRLECCCIFDGIVE